MFGTKENKLLRKALALYAGERVLKRVLRNGEDGLIPEAGALELTMLFLDVASFIAVPGGLDPTALGNFSVDYCEAITRAVAKCDGTFDTFVGDSASAWWGEDGEIDHPVRACACARELVFAIESLNARSSASGYPKVWIKIGVHTGRVSLGNFGSTSRLRYTVMGDAVNLASRLCSVAGPEHASRITISGATKERLNGVFPVVPQEPTRVKGMDGLVEVYGMKL